jgi:hypothetical protein
MLSLMRHVARLTDHVAFEKVGSSARQPVTVSRVCGANATLAIFLCA